MDNIFCDILSFVSNTAISGITWDLMKSKGEKLISSFKKNVFRSVISEDECKDFLEKLFIEKKKNYNIWNDVEDAFKSSFGDKYDFDDFKIYFETWLKENKSEFENLKSSQSFNDASIHINKQVSSGNGKIINAAGIVNIY